MNVADRLRSLGACAEAVRWAETQPSAAAAWRACPRGDDRSVEVARRSPSVVDDAREIIAWFGRLAVSECVRLVLPVTADIIRRYFPRPPRLPRDPR